MAKLTVMVCGCSNFIGCDIRKERVCAGEAYAVRHKATIVVSAEEDLSEAEIENRYLRHLTTLAGQETLVRSKVSLNEIEHARELLKENDNVVIVSSSWHLGRLKKLAERHLSEDEYNRLIFKGVQHKSFKQRMKRIFVLKPYEVLANCQMLVWCVHKLKGL